MGVIYLNELIYEKKRLEERYRTLSDLWEPNSKHHTHLKISREITDTLNKLEETNKIHKEKFGY
jgi:hypothetical protein